MTHDPMLGRPAMLRAGVHEGVGRVVVDLLGLHRADDADVVGDVGDVRQPVADRLAGGAVPGELRLRPEAEELLLRLELRDRLAGGERGGNRLAVHRGELRLVVEEFELRRPARHAEEDHALGLGREMERIDDAAAPRR